MDLYFSQQKANNKECLVIDNMLEKHSKEEVRDDLLKTYQIKSNDRVLIGKMKEKNVLRSFLLPVLHELQKEIGWISPGALNYLGEKLNIPPAEAYGVATFYSLLATERRSPVVAHICTDIACHRSAGEICDYLKTELGSFENIEPDKPIAWLPSSCLGMCERSPAIYMQVTGADDTVIAPIDLIKIRSIIKELNDGKESLHSKNQRSDRFLSLIKQDNQINFSVPQIQLEFEEDCYPLLKRVGKANSNKISEYCSCGGYNALKKAIELGPQKVLKELHLSKLVGRGGAAFPTALKWEAVYNSEVSPHFVVCNADESEPGTFKDRVLMEQDPFAVIEAMTIAGITTGSKTGYIYIRGEYPEAIKAIENALMEAKSFGFIGSNILNSGWSFDIEIRRGGGAYICGEETALFNSIEGYRGEPRSKPPYPTEFGLFGKPTSINNVETLVNLLPIITSGGKVYSERGTASSAGTKLFCLSGDIKFPGLYEVNFGITLRQLINLAGGTVLGAIKAVLIGGAAGTFIGVDNLDVEMTFEGTREIGASLGSGSVIIFSEKTDFQAILKRIAGFFRDESCGQCVPCRIGTVRQEEALYRFAKAQKQDDGFLLEELANVMKDASICGLGHTASTALQSAVKLGLLS